MKRKIFLGATVLCLALTACQANSNETGANGTNGVTVAGADASATTESEETTTASKVEIAGQEYALDAESVDLSNVSIEEVSKLAETLAQFANLKSVNLGKNKLTVDHCISLKESLPGVEFNWEVTLFEGIVLNNDTTKLDISTHIVEDADKFGKIVGYFPNLTYIDMCDCGLTNEQMEVLRDTYTNIKFVWKVTFDRWTIRTDTISFSTMKTCADTFFLSSEDAQVLKYCTDMVALDIGHNSVTDVSFLQYMPNLKVLILVDQGNHNTGEYLSDLSVLKYCPKLEYLEFFVGDVRDTSFLQYLPNLVDLNVSYNPITDITYLKQLPNIERLFIEHTGISAAGFEELKATYPNAQIELYGEGSIDHGWREHPRYFAMRSMFDNNNVHELFMD